MKVRNKKQNQSTKSKCLVSSFSPFLSIQDTKHFTLTIRQLFFIFKNFKYIASILFLPKSVLTYIVGSDIHSLNHFLSDNFNGSCVVDFSVKDTEDNQGEYHDQACFSHVGITEK